MFEERPLIPGLHRLLYMIGDMVQSLRLPVTEWNEEFVCNAASRRTGLDDFGDLYFQEGLAQLLTSAKNDAQLRFMGRFALTTWIITQLTNRLLLYNVVKHEPDIFEAPLIPPLIITGLPRSGTTLLYRLLAIDPTFRYLPLWEALRPVRNIKSKLDLRRQYAFLEHYLRKLRMVTTDIDQKHVLSPDDPEECTWMLGMSFVNITPWILAPVYEYLPVFLRQDLLQKKYREYRWLLQILQAESPNRRLVLKAPEHLGMLDILVQNVPNALIVQTHRHPVSAINSFNSLCDTIHRVLSYEDDPNKLGAINLELLSRGTKRNLEAREHIGSKVYDIYYEQLVTDPIGTVRGIYDNMAIDWLPGVEERMRRYLQKNPKDKHGKHVYHAEYFGLTDRKIEQSFQEYIEKFGFTDRRMC